MLTSCACTVTFHLMYNYKHFGTVMLESEAGLQSVSVLGASNLFSALSDSSAPLQETFSLTELIFTKFIFGRL